MPQSPAAIGKTQPAAALGLCLLVLAGCAGSNAWNPLAYNRAGGSSNSLMRNLGDTYSFTTIDDPKDPTFNVITGVNNQDTLTGYYGNGLYGHLNRGYIVHEPWGPENFKNENYPSAKSTQITGLNNRHTIVGFDVPPASGSKGWIFGCVDNRGIWGNYKDPALRKGKSNITELLGVNDAGLVVGFYTDDASVNHAFELNLSIGKYHSIIPPGLISVSATGINGKGDIVGYATTALGTVSYMLKGGTFTFYSYPGSLDTKALGINWQDQIVGSYVDAGGATHGFVLTDPLFSQQWQSITESKVASTTVVTGIEDARNIVGYYVDAAGNTNGFFGMVNFSKR